MVMAGSIHHLPLGHCGLCGVVQWVQQGLSPSLSLFPCLPPPYTTMISVIPPPRACTVSATR